MIMAMGAIWILTSGGDAPGMNAALRGLVKIAASRGVEVVGVCDGFQGLVEGRTRALTQRSGGTLAPTPEVEGLSRLGGSMLGTARSDLFMTPEGRARAAAPLKDCAGLVVIGGNGSLQGAHMLATEHQIRVVGIPASIDNDIGSTSICIGVDTALNTIVDACDRISDTASAHRRAFVVEVMGRDCGYLAMASAIAVEADAVMFREQGRADDEVLEQLGETVTRCLDPRNGKKRALVIKAEGVRLPTAKIVDSLQACLDQSSVQGASVRATILGHLVRGGSPSYRDRMIAGRFALAAIR
ncbi:MAG: 6-phosphofructokinase, partial [Nannocystaceae bacterium]